MRPNWLLWGNQSMFWRAVLLLAFVRLTQKPWAPRFVKRIKNLFFKIDEFIVDHRAEQIFTLTVNISVWDHWKVLGKALLLLIVPADVVVGVDGGGVGDAVLHLLVALHCFLLLCEWAPPPLLLLVSILIAGVPEQKELQNQRLMKAFKAWDYNLCTIIWYIDYRPRLPA